MIPARGGLRGCIPAPWAYHVHLEPWVFVASTLVAVVIALLTVGGQAYLVARASPVKALRHE